MATHTLYVPDWKPTSLNGLMASVQAKIKAKKRDREMVTLYARMADIPKANCRRRVSVEIGYSGRARECDPDNLTKSLLDALVSCGLLLDDAAAFVLWAGVEQRRDETTWTRITLEDL